MRKRVRTEEQKARRRIWELKNNARRARLVKEKRHALGISKWYAHEMKGKPKKDPSLRKSRYERNGKIYCETWLELRKEIYRRDKWKCQECGVHCHNGPKRKIQCHHIDYNVNNNSGENLITLCASCHAKTNFKRSDWIAYFRRKRKGY